MSDTTPERWAELRRQAEKGNLGALILLEAIELAEAEWAALRARLRDAELLLRDTQVELELAEAEQAKVLAFLRQRRTPGGGPLAHPEGCWAWHTECLAAKVRRMLGDER